MQEYAKHIARRMLSTFEEYLEEKKSLFIFWNGAEK